MVALDVASGGSESNEANDGECCAEGIEPPGVGEKEPYEPDECGGVSKRDAKEEPGPIADDECLWISAVEWTLEEARDEQADDAIASDADGHNAG